METVRNFLEKIVEGLIGNVDDTSIDRLYSHPAYKPTADPPTVAHTALREIVERAVNEAQKLPSLGGSDETERTQEGRNIAEHSYEDLLATAILNKVIEKYQKEQVDGNSNVLHEKPTARTKCTLSESELGLDEGVEEGCSSLEPLSQDDCSDCSASCSRHVRNKLEPLSLTIEERIEEVTTTYTSDEDHRDNDVLAIRNAHRVPFPELGMDIIDPSQESSEDGHDEPDTPTSHVDLISPVESWEENWLFQKKRVQTQADPVAMLVPNSSADFKALIGDKDAEDTSDLSECSSAQSDEEIEKELMEAINNVVPRSPKKLEFNGGNNIDERASNDLRSTEICESEILFNGISQRERNDDETEDLEKTDKQISKEATAQNDDTKNCRIRGNDEEKGSLNKNVEPNASDAGGKNEAKEITVELCKVENQKAHESPSSGDIKCTVVEKDVLECKKPIVESSNVVSTDCKKIESEYQKEAPGSTTESNADPVHSQNVSERTKPKDLLEKSSSNSINSTQSLVPLTDEHGISDLPKTPASTPTIFMLEVNLENKNDTEALTSCDENVLNSLERAKKKLMVMDDDTIETFKEEEGKRIFQKPDFQTEDVQQESEYTEHYDIAIQRHLDSLTKSDISIGDNEGINDDGKDLLKGLEDQSLEEKESKCREAVALAKAESASYSSLQNKKPEEEVQLATPPRPGTIAEREHKKWENAAPIENNPYSEENIQKRLWERQYSRRSSDIPGINAELPKNNGADLEAILTPHEPNIKRFGRDYYINESKTPSGERGRRSTASISSRPSSSLSQRSNSTGGEQEQQEEIQYKESDSHLSKTNDVKAKVAKWQKNNVEANYQLFARRSGNSNSTIQSYGTEKCDEKCVKKNDCQKTWEDQHVDEILENERKNSKNEINAKLNNQENYDNIGMLEAKKSYSDENQKKIRRIDLKAYGFENEFCLNDKKAIRTSSQRVINKLDLKSFGYDDGIRRTQSNNHLDSTIVDGDFKPRIVRVTNKSNLTRHSNYSERNDCQDLMETQASGDNNLTQSTEALNKLGGEAYDTFAPLKSAKSVPNIVKCEYYSNSSNDQDDEEIESYNTQNSYGAINELDIINNGNMTKVLKNYQPEMFNIKNGNSLNEDSENDTDNSSEKDQPYQSMEKLLIHDEKQEFSERDLDDNKLPMPSVRRLAQAFNKQPDATPTPAPRVARPSGANKERSSTPEIHLVETPRQMHSLTARSLSKKFREGLRQIPNKVTSPPASHVIMEQSRLSENQTEVVQSKGDNPLNDTNVISPGKLKSNIIFWEQMQRRS